MISAAKPLVEFIQAYSFMPVYINPKYVASVQRHSVWTNEWTVIVCSNEKYIVLERIETVFEKLDIEKQI